jgi:hypothetical protein
MIERDKFPAGPALAYDTLRAKLKTGDVLICSGTGIFSGMIQQATDSVWSHVGMIVRLDDVDRVMLLESLEPVGVRTVRLSSYLDGYDPQKRTAYKGGLVIIRHKDFTAGVPNSKLRKLIQFAVDRFGYPYDRDEIAKIASRIMAWKIPFTKRQMRRIEPDEEYICSEYVAKCYEEIGISVQWNPAGFVAPADFASDPSFSLVGIMKTL